MAKKLELNFSSSKDAEIVRFIQLNADENTSPIFICALEYNIKTGKYLNIGKVCTNSLRGSEKVRKPIYVPNNSVVEEWADCLKEERKGLLSSKVRYILKNSITLVNTEAEEKIEEYIDLLMAVDRLREHSYENTLLNSEVEEPRTEEEVKEETEPIAENTATEPHSKIYSRPPNIDYSDLEDTEVEEKKTKNKGVGLLDKMMPVDF